MPFFVYVLRSSRSGKLYKGQAEDVEERLLQHNAGHTKSTKSDAGYWKLVYTEEFETHGEAVRRERYFKSAAGRRYLKKVLGLWGWKPRIATTAPDRF